MYDCTLDCKAFLMCKTDTKGVYHPSLKHEATDQAATFDKLGVRTCC